MHINALTEPRVTVRTTEARHGQPQQQKSIMAALAEIPSPQRLRELKGIRKEINMIRDARGQMKMMKARVKPTEARWLAQRRSGLLRSVLKAALEDGARTVQEVSPGFVKKWLWENRTVGLRTLAKYTEEVQYELEVLRDPARALKAEGRLLRSMATLIEPVQATPISSGEAWNAAKLAMKKHGLREASLLLALWASAGRLQETLEVSPRDVCLLQGPPPEEDFEGPTLRMTVRSKASTDSWCRPVHLPIEGKTLAARAARAIWSWRGQQEAAGSPVLWQREDWRRAVRCCPTTGVRAFRRGKAQSTAAQAARKATAKVLRHAGTKNVPRYLFQKGGERR